jgi:hypothetical protein
MEEVIHTKVSDQFIIISYHVFCEDINPSRLPSFIAVTGLLTLI